MRSFTLVELIVVVIIIGILVTFAAPQYFVTRERALQREGRASLGLIIAAERIWRMETDTDPPACYISSDIADINDNLKLSLPNGTMRNWNYYITVSATPANTCCARAVRVINGTEDNTRGDWHLGFADPEPADGACPP